MAQAILSSNESSPFGMLPGMKTTGERIRHLRHDVLKLKQREFADQLGVSRGAVGNWERDQGIKRENLIEIADRFFVSAEWLINGRGAPPESTGFGPESKPSIKQGVGSSAGVSNASARTESPISSRVLIPVYGKAAGGAETDGRFILNGQRLAEVVAPASLEHVPDAYSVYVHGSSMEPRYFAGEGVWVHPHRPVRQGDFAVVQIQPDHDGEPPYGLVKQFWAMQGSNLVLKQLNPAKGQKEEMRFPSDRVISIHKIVGSFEP